MKENFRCEIYLSKKMTYRNDAVLRFIKYKKKGQTNLADLEDEYKRILQNTEILQTLKKLETFGLIDCINEKYSSGHLVQNSFI